MLGEINSVYLKTRHKKDLSLIESYESNQERIKRASREIVVNSSILAVVFLLQISGSVFCCKNIQYYNAILLAGQIFQGLLKKACDAELTVMTTLLINAKKMQYILAANRLMK